MTVSSDPWAEAGEPAGGAVPVNAPVNAHESVPIGVLLGPARESIAGAHSVGTALHGSDAITIADRQLILELIRDARLNGILEIEFKSLRIRLSPMAAEHAQRQTYIATHSGASGAWSNHLPKARP